METLETQPEASILAKCVSCDRASSELGPCGAPLCGQCAEDTQTAKCAFCRERHKFVDLEIRDIMLHQERVELGEKIDELEAHYAILDERFSDSRKELLIELERRELCYKQRIETQLKMMKMAHQDAGMYLKHMDDKHNVVRNNFLAGVSRWICLSV